MHRLRSTLLLGLLLTVIMFALTVQGGEEECLGMAGKAPILCYHCQGLYENNYCSDPFNDTHPNVELKRCKEYCVKWTRWTLSGKMYFERTCSDLLNINMRKSVVCIEESRPSNGTLCFCDKDKCNTATSTSVTFVTSLLFLAFLHVLFDHRHILPGIQNGT